MSLLDSLIKAFSPKANSIFKEEKYSSYEIKYETSINSPINYKSISKVINKIHTNDIWRLTIAIENFDPITINRSDRDINKFVNDINKQLDTVENETINFHLFISKKVFNANINIYDFSLFCNFVKGLEPIAFLNIINDDLKGNGKLNFNVFDNSFDNFFTPVINFKKENDAHRTNSHLDILKIKENCHFGNQDEYPYSPLHFNLIQKPKIENYVTNKLDILSCLFSITSIFNITTIKDNILHYKLYGYKTVENEIPIKNLPIKSRDTYIKIFKWIYLGTVNISDRIGLSRNIISIYLQDNLLNIQDNAYYSIQSGFNIYLQENLNRYIEVRNKIGEQLLTLTQNANNVLEDYLNSYHKSSFTFVTFFISVFLIRVLNTGNFEDVFTKDASVIAFSILLISTIYLIFSILRLNAEKKRLTAKYASLKNRFKDLLIDDDINKILRDDEEFNSELQFIISRRFTYALLWSSTIIIFLGTVITLSSYYNWNFFIYKLKLLIMLLS